MKSNDYKETDIGKIPVEWDVVNFKDSITAKSFQEKEHLQQAQFNSRGKYPIVDQGSSNIAGYTDDESLVHIDGLPIVIFGDHTRIFKYIDFPFVLGADGTKILKPDAVKFDAKFFFYCLIQLDIPSKGYSRHYKYLKENSLVCPPLTEQRTIAAILSKIQQAIEVQEKIIERIKELKKSLMAKFFTEGLHSEELKETEIGLMPKSWNVATIGSIASEGIKNGAFIKNPKWGSGVKYLNVVDTYKDELVDISSLMRVEVTNAMKENYLLKENDILFVRSSLKEEGIAQSCYVLEISEPLIYDCHLMKVSPKLETIDSMFLVLYCLTERGKKALIAKSNKTTMTTINQMGLSGFEFPLPPLEEQKEISAIARGLNSKVVIHQRQLICLQAVFKSMLHELMTGTIRVNNMNL